jgi:hypothetical protein
MGVKNELFPLKCIWLLLHCLARPRWQVILFSIYYDDVLCRLQRAGVGCYIGQIFTGALSNADDLVLLAPTASAMRRMLAVCEDYAAEFQVSFNADKTKWMVFTPKPRHVRYNVPVVCRNVHFCAQRYGVNCDTLLIASDVVNLYYQFVSSHLSLDDLYCVSCASELISVRYGALRLSGFSPDDMDSMISLLKFCRLLLQLEVCFYKLRTSNFVTLLYRITG